jgi:hypothetical protein
MDPIGAPPVARSVATAAGHSTLLAAANTIAMEK